MQPHVSGEELRAQFALSKATSQKLVRAQWLHERLRQRGVVQCGFR